MDRFEIPLDIEDVKLEAVESTPNNEIIITVTSTVEGTDCHRCGKKNHRGLWRWARNYAAALIDFREADLYSN